MKKTSANKRTKVDFQITAHPDSAVSVAGSFNHWDPKENRLRHTSGTWIHSLTLALPPGRHEYKFVVDGQWCLDPNCREQVASDLGSMNNVVVV